MLDLLRIEPLPSWVWHQHMADFADGIFDQAAGRSLLRAIQGKGAFRLFRNRLHENYAHLLPAWHAFQFTPRAKRRAVELLSTTHSSTTRSRRLPWPAARTPTCPEPTASTWSSCRWRRQSAAYGTATKIPLLVHIGRRTSSVGHRRRNASGCSGSPIRQ
jgi:hypothetical protein